MKSRDSIDVVISTLSNTRNVREDIENIPNGSQLRELDSELLGL